MSYSRIEDEDGEAPVQNPFSAAIATQSSEAVRFGKRAGMWPRWSPLGISALGVFLSAVPVSLRWCGFQISSSSKLYGLIKADQPTVQVLVSILAAIFGFLWTFAVCAAFNMVMRASISRRRNVFWEDLRLYVAVSTRTPDMSLKWLGLCQTVSWWMLMLVPARLWTGALTPHMATSVQHGSVFTPCTGNANQTKYHPIADYDPIHGFNFSAASNATYTSSPGVILSGRIIASMRSASSLNGWPQNFSKDDGSSYTYLGRSYGAGSAVGLTELPFNNVQNYSFQEQACVASAVCNRNETTTWGTYDNLNHFQPSMYDIKGLRPNQPPDQSQNYTTSYKQWSFARLNGEPIDAVSFSAGSSGDFLNGTPPFYLSIAAGQRYQVLNQTQCEISFRPAPLTVRVSLSNRTIQILPDEDTIKNSLLSGSQNAFAEWTLRELQKLTMVKTSLFVSTVGEALVGNFRTKEPSLDLESPASVTALQLLSESITVAIDEIMAGLNTYALTDPIAGYQKTDARFEIFAIETGGQAYCSSTFALNVGAFVIITAIGFYTRFFSESPAFNFADLPSMASGACHEVTDTDMAGGASHLADWDGEADNKRLRASQFEFNCKLGAVGPPFVIVKPSRGHGTSTLG